MSKKKIGIELNSQIDESTIVVAAIGEDPQIVSLSPSKTYTDKGAQMVTKNTYQKVFGKNTTLGEVLLLRARRV